MRQAITTKYLGPTNHKGARVRARNAAGHTVTLGWDHGLESKQNHIEAAKALAMKLGWESDRWYGGSMGVGYVFVEALPSALVE